MRWFFLTYEHEPLIKGDMGGYRKVWELAEALSQQGEEVMVFSASACAPVQKPVTAVTVPVLNVPLLRPLSVYLGFFLRALIAGFRCPVDILYARTLHLPVAPLLARLLRARLVAEVDGDSYALHQRLGASRLRLAYLRLTDGYTYRRSDHLIPITPGLRDMLHDRHGIQAHRITVIASGTNLELLRPAGAEGVRQKLGLVPVEGPVVGFAGTCYAYQGIDTLIRSAPPILAGEPSTRFLIVGDGTMREAWEAEAERCGVARAFTFTGQVPYHRVADYLNAMDVCVCPWQATRGETSPLKLFDSMACGRPVVASDIPSIHEPAIRSGATILVPPEDPASLAAAILSLIRNPELRERMGQQGRRFVEAEYGWDRQAGRLLAVGRQICERSV